MIHVVLLQSQFQIEDVLFQTKNQILQVLESQNQNHNLQLNLNLNHHLVNKKLLLNQMQ